jgi:fructose 1,6-bisphosphatase
MPFTVKIKPRTIIDEQTTLGTVKARHTVYDLYVYDGEGDEDEQLLVFSNQGYENRKFAERLAWRLFGASSKIAAQLGISPIQSRVAEPVRLEVQDAFGIPISIEDMR